MNLFGKTSNDYYDEYKAELEKKEKNNGFFSLSTVIKIETFIIVLGILFMGYNDFFATFSEKFSLKLNEDSFISQSLFQSDETYQNGNSALIMQLKEEETAVVEPFEPQQEESHSIENNVKMLAKNLDIDFNELSLIVEIIKSEMTGNCASNREEDKILLGQL